MGEKDLTRYLKNRIEKCYEEVEFNDQYYLYAKGNIPVMLVAHIDTVSGSKPTNIKFDSKRNTLSTNSVLGADDRAGIAAILQLIHEGFRPHILFCQDEECGGVGASMAGELLKIEGVNIVVELDRRGSTDFVTYDCENPEMDKWISEFGFKKSYGTFTDISFICPDFGIGGVNLSIGYYNEHTKSEFLNLIDWSNTIAKVKKILLSPPQEKFDYIKLPGTRYSDGWDYKYYRDYDYDYKKSATTTSSKTVLAEGIAFEITAEEIMSYDYDGDLDWYEIVDTCSEELNEVAREAAIKAIINYKNDYLYNVSTSRR
jgi:hypothetical protein